jgi:hypothetical protein
LNTENTTMTNDCKTCPVSTGTHKPAEAVHQIDEPQADALLELAAYRFTVENREARIAELEKENSYLNNACAELESQLEAIGAGGVEPLRKGFVRLTDVLARLEQGFGANSAPVTTIKRHFEMQAATHHTQQGLEPIEQRQLAIGQAVERACKELPEGAEIQIYLERGAGTVNMTDWDGNEFDHFDQDHEDFACRINAAIDGAIAADQAASQAKQGEQANG